MNGPLPSGMMLKVIEGEAYSSSFNHHSAIEFGFRISDHDENETNSSIRLIALVPDLLLQKDRFDITWRNCLQNMDCQVTI